MDPARPAEGQTDVSNTNQDESTVILSRHESAPSTVDCTALQNELHQTILGVDDNIPSEHMDSTGTDQPQGADQRTEPVPVTAPKPVGSSGASIIVSPRQVSY